MDRRFGASVLLVCCLAILIRFVKPYLLAGQLLSDGLVEETLDFDPLITEWPPLAVITPYDFYKISMQWPKTVCDNIPGCFTPPSFTIHGLWPHYRPDRQVPPYDPTNPNRCTNATPASAASITRRTLRPILNNMDPYWPNLQNPNTNGDLWFWRREWNKHGQCWNTPTQPNAYFRQALSFPIRHNLFDILRGRGIEPNNTRTYSRNNIADAVRTELGRIPEINCNSRRQLKEIRVCYNRTNGLINCPRQFTGCNALQLAYPTP